MNGFEEDNKAMSIELCPNFSALETLVKHKTDGVKLQYGERNAKFASVLTRAVF
jgi:hypothetical protein